MLLEGKVAIVTGASRGIGFAVAKAYACEGARVAVCGSREETAQKAVAQLQKLCPGAEFLPIGVDVSDADAIRAMVARVVERWGKIDILVNNAASPGQSPFST